jgi:hypothetical protein
MRSSAVLCAALAAFSLAGCNAPQQNAAAPPTAGAPASASAAPLASWNEGARPGKPSSTSSRERQRKADFVRPAERIAVFDNDGTLWAEQPMYFQIAFALDRIKAPASKHPEWKTTQPFKGVLEGDLKAVLAGGEHSLMQVMAASHAGNTTEEFESIVSEWIGSARHPGDSGPVLLRLPRDRPHRRQGRQAGRHPPGHRPQADDRLRKF